MTENNPGQLYKESGKINTPNYIIYFIIGVGLQGLLGIGYGFLSHINPLIYLNFLILGGAIAITAAINGIIIPAMKVRNSFAKYLYIILGGSFLLYNAWAGVIGSDLYYMSPMDGFMFKLSITDIIDFASQQNMSIGKFGRDGMEMGALLGICYLIEMLILIFVPVFIASWSREYYCESCEQNYDTKMAYFTRTTFESFMNKNQGDLMELAEEGILSSVNQLRPNVQLVEFNFHICKGCSKGIADAEFGITKLNDKKVSEYQKKSTELKGLYLNQKTSDFINSKFV